MNVLLCHIFAVSMVRGTRKKASTIVDTSEKPLWQKWEDGGLDMSHNYLPVNEEVEDLTAVPKNGYFSKKAYGTEGLDIPKKALFTMTLKCPITPGDEEYELGKMYTSTIKWMTSDPSVGQTMWGFQSTKTNVLWEKAYEMDGFTKTTNYERAGGQHSHGFMSPAVLEYCPPHLPVKLHIEFFSQLDSDESLSALSVLGIYDYGSANITNMRYDIGSAGDGQKGGNRGTIAFEFEQTCGIANKVLDKDIAPVSPYCSPNKKGLVVLSFKTVKASGKVASVRRVTLYTEK